MPLKKWIRRILRIAGLTTIAVLSVAFLAIKAQMLLERNRAERLMADIHQIRLYQSTWSDAQKLMSRWGKWGHYDGTCTAADCRYRIILEDNDFPLSRVLLWLSQHGGLSVCTWLGDRYPRLSVSFTVKDGTIWRTTAGLLLGVPPKRWDKDDFGYELIVNTKSRQRLHRTKSDWWIMGNEDDLADHPYYMAGRPGGCTMCEEAVVTYSTHTPPAEIERLTAFNFSCFTRLLPCTTPDQLLPAAREWHLYRDDEQYAIQQQQKSLPPKPCDIPLWALGRDQSHVLVVDVLSTAMEKGWDRMYQVAGIKIVASLKGSLPWPIGTVVKAAPFSGDSQNPPYTLAEHLVPGRRYIVLPKEDERDNPEIYGDGPKIGMPRCGVWEDTPAVRRELEKGYAQNHQLRGPEGL
jgi:hypothetical protein